MVDSVSRPSPDGGVGLSRIAGTDLALPRPFSRTPSHERTVLYNTSAKFAKRSALFSLPFSTKGPGRELRDDSRNEFPSRGSSRDTAFRLIPLDSRARQARRVYVKVYD
jgi:hypothetical protein